MLSYKTLAQAMFVRGESEGNTNKVTFIECFWLSVKKVSRKIRTYFDQKTSVQCAVRYVYDRCI